MDPFLKPPQPGPRPQLRDLVAYFLRLGTVGFGGPVALVGQMERELVTERRWVEESELRQAVAVCQSLPGPLAVQVGIFISYLRAGFWGAWAAGWAFILPNFVIVTGLAALYVRAGDLPLLRAVFYGVSPAVIALILHSCYRLIKLGIEDSLQWVIAAVCFAATVALRAEVALLFVGAGLVAICADVITSRRTAGVPVLAVAPVVGPLLAKLLVFFLKAGSLTFGSGLVIVPFLEKGLVRQNGWLDERQFLTAVAIGMLSPGPVVITATFVGYLVAGFWGAVASTIGIFLPSFALVLLVAPLLIRYRTHLVVRGFVKGAYAAAIGTILGAAMLLAKIAIGDWLTALVAMASLAALARWNVRTYVLVAGAAIIGLIAFPLLAPTWTFVK